MPVLIEYANDCLTWVRIAVIKDAVRFQFELLARIWIIILFSTYGCVFCFVPITDICKSAFQEEWIQPLGYRQNYFRIADIFMKQA